MKDPKFGYHWVWILPYYWCGCAYEWLRAIKLQFPRKKLPLKEEIQRIINK